MAPVYTQHPHAAIISLCYRQFIALYGSSSISIHCCHDMRSYWVTDTHTDMLLIHWLSFCRRGEIFTYSTQHMVLELFSIRWASPVQLIAFIGVDTPILLIQINSEISLKHFFFLQLLVSLNRLYKHVTAPSISGMCVECAEWRWYRLFLHTDFFSTDTFLSHRSCDVNNLRCY